ncbi:hypothetical protein PsYK624_084950 [Phanerochaete sordida]|uniref:Uncharacterized protein n=1 Tax=Phanerochaete sordida TaxID=48140 RepID=A0A9P3GCN8_9APHY|nr:hypothetical protein PsYK624_084950 [Phanerochaete sordida]
MSSSTQAPSPQRSALEHSAHEVAYYTWLADVEVVRRQLHLIKYNRGYLEFEIRDADLQLHSDVFNTLFMLAEDIEVNTLVIWLLRCEKRHLPAFKNVVKMVRFVRHQQLLLCETDEDEGKAELERYMIDLSEARLILLYLSAVMDDFRQARPPRPLPPLLAQRFPNVPTDRPSRAPRRDVT